MAFTLYHSYISPLNYDTKEDREWERNPETENNLQ